MIVKTVLKAKASNQVATTSADQTVVGAAQLLHKHRIGALVVVDAENGIDGILSERDIARGLAQYGPDLGNLPVHQLMTRGVLTCSPDDSIEHLMAIMTEKRVRHLPVVEHGKLVGIMTIGDVVKNRLEEAVMEVDQLRGYVMAG
ncbi:MAG TPA: CBS domain-containing protein [Candidatus Sulfotelmatobacter sp.]|jgi:CBS domain-containing protein|nr:CBS domain-containing protein [Candidatus Sulfotelmatobacter sp.]